MSDLRMPIAEEVFDTIVIGAGVAGLAATAALTGAGGRVALLDRKPFVGGRAYSYPHPALGETVDSQHILVGCCTSLRHLCKQTGLADAIAWYDRYTFLEPGGRRSDLVLSALPAPLHTAPSFATVGMLSLTDKVAIGRALTQFLRGYPARDGESVAAWLRRTHQPDHAIRHFWEPVIVGALNDTLDRCSMRYAGQVFHETFLRSAEGGRFGVPRLPLSEFYGHVADHCVAGGATLRLGASVEGLNQVDGLWQVTLTDGSMLRARTVVCAVSFEHVGALLGADMTERALPAGLTGFVHSPITTIHLWYDQPFTDLEHAVLLDTGIQWLFHKSRIRRWPAERGSYVELTISASHKELREGRETLLSRSLEELAGFFPEARSATLRKSGVLKEAKATFSVLPGMDRVRPAQQTAVDGLFLAGDWTCTGWPSTMEGGVRSGYLAAEAVRRHLGASDSEPAAGARFLQPDLPTAGFMRLLARQ